MSDCCSCDEQYASALQSIAMMKAFVSGTYGFKPYDVNELQDDGDDKILDVINKSTDSRKIQYLGVFDGKHLFENLII